MDNLHCPYCGKAIEPTDRDVTRHGDFNFLWHIQCVRKANRPTIIRLEEENVRLRKVLEDLRFIINESHGVVGYHLNGDVATWEEFGYPEEIDEVLTALA